jgi:hypothetical protein
VCAVPSASSDEIDASRVKKRVDMEHAQNLNNHVLCICLLPPQLLASHFFLNNHIYPNTRNINIKTELSLLPSSTHARLTQACLVDTKVQYLQASKQRLAHHHRTHSPVGCKQARSGRALQSRTSSCCPTVAFLASSAEELACMSRHVGRSGGQVGLLSPTQWRSEGSKSRAEVRPCDIGCATEMIW